MHHRFNITLGLGSFGIIGRIAIALALLLLLKHFDRNSADQYSKAVKWLLVGGLICFVLALFVIGAIRGFSLLPFRYWLY